MELLGLRALLIRFNAMLRDVVQSAVPEVTFRQLAQKLHATRGIPLLDNPVNTIEVLSQRYSLNDGECGGVLCHLIQGGELSGYGLVNAVTH